MRNRTNILLACAMAFFLLSHCKEAPKTTSQKIEALQEQVRDDAQDLQKLHDLQFVELHRDFMVCDSMLQHLSEEQIDAGFDMLNLAQAYLEQFEAVEPTMLIKMDFLAEQLSLLKADLESQYLSDSLALVYLETESLVADTLHEQILYFKDRFGRCQKDINGLKKNWKKPSK